MTVQFRMETARDDGVLTVRCVGELDMATAPEVEALTKQLIEEQAPAEVKLDWSGLTFMDSTGIRALLRIVVICRDAKVPLTWSLSQIARRSLDLVGVHDGLLREYGEQD